jgi:hypothetical protein
MVILSRQYHAKFCSKQVDLRVDLSADENGKVVHEPSEVHYLGSMHRTRLVIL